MPMRMRDVIPVHSPSTHTHTHTRTLPPRLCCRPPITCGCTPLPPLLAAQLDLHYLSVMGARIVLRAWLLYLKRRALAGERLDPNADFRIVTGEAPAAAAPWGSVYCCGRPAPAILR
jgi:hypothetical protein